jgi:hypothetical protein
LAILLTSPLLSLLSPLFLVAAVLLFGVSLIGLVVRAGQRWTGRRVSFSGWGTAAVASLVLMFAFAGVSGALYGGAFARGPNLGSGDAGEVAGGSAYAPS